MKHPDHKTRRLGTTALTLGALILTTAWVSALAGAVTKPPHPWHGGPAQLLGLLAFSALTTLGGVLLTLGFLERLTRAVRDSVRDNAEALATIMGLVAPVPGRLDAIDQSVASVPSFGEGVILGAEMRRTVVGKD